MMAIWNGGWAKIFLPEAIWIMKWILQGYIINSFRLLKACASLVKWTSAEYFIYMYDINSVIGKYTAVHDLGLILPNSVRYIAHLKFYSNAVECWHCMQKVIGWILSLGKGDLHILIPPEKRKA